MTQELTYEQTIELEENIKLKNQAEKIYNDFLKNVKLNVSSYKGDGKFLFWSDEHNAIYFRLYKDVFEFQCRFLHETYNITVRPSEIFTALKRKSGGIDHLISAVANNI